VYGNAETATTKLKLCGKSTQIVYGSFELKKFIHIMIKLDIVS